MLCGDDAFLRMVRASAKLRTDFIDPRKEDKKISAELAGNEFGRVHCSRGEHGFVARGMFFVSAMFSLIGISVSKKISVHFHLGFIFIVRTENPAPV